MYSIITPRSLRYVATTRRATVLYAANYSSTMHDKDPEVLEREKQRNLAKMQPKKFTLLEHAPGWNECLATASEASVKADKYRGSLLELQQKTVEYVHARHSPEDPHEAGYSHDTVLGPLGGAEGTEDTRDHHETVKKNVKRKKTKQSRVNE